MSADSRRVVLSGLTHRVASCLRPSAENHLVDVESICPLCATVTKLVDHCAAPLALGTNSSLCQYRHSQAHKRVTDLIAVQETWTRSRIATHL